MIIYAVQYSTGYDYNEIISYHSSEEEAEKAAKEAEKKIKVLASLLVRLN